MGFNELVRERRAHATAIAGYDGRIPIDHIRPNPDQPRREIDETSTEFEELRQSIWQQGLIQPVVVVRPDPEADAYVLLAGERRWRAFRSLASADAARFSSIPAVVRDAGDVGGATNALVIGLLENVVREDLRPGDRAAAVARLRTLTTWTYDEIAQRMGMTPRRVHALAAIARNEAVVETINEGKLTQDQAVAVVAAAQGNVQLAADLVGRVQNTAAADVRDMIRQAMPPSSSAGNTGGETESGAVATDMVALRETVLAVLKPRVTEMHRDDLRGVLHRALRQTKVS